MDFTDSEALFEIQNKDEEGDFEENGESDRPLAHQAAASGEIEILTAAIKADPTVIESRDVEGLTPLIHAVMAEQLDAVKLLVKMGASINIPDSLGRTCLSMASYQGWYSGVQFLLRNGAQASLCDGSGRSALHSATYSTDHRVIEALLMSITEEEVNIQDNEGMTVLHWATFHNRPSHIKKLLERGIDMFIVDVDGKSVIHWAALNNCSECCEILLKNCQGIGELVNLHDYSGKTAAHFAAAAGHADTLRTLAAVEICDMDAEDPEERTPLHWAAANGQAEALQTLLDLNVEACPVDVDGNTPLDYARQSGLQECSSLLERKLGIRPTNHDKNGTNIEAETTAKNRRNGPLDFFVGLFRPKRPAKSDPSTRSPNQNSACQTSDSDPNQNSYFTLNVSVNGTAEPSGTDDQCTKESTSSQNCDYIVTKDIEKLHISRCDNPTLSKVTSPEYELKNLNSPSKVKEALPKSLEGNIPVSPACDNEKGDIPDHSYLIRSPPPQIRRDRSVSPAHSVMLRSETNRAQLEEDAAQILALHKGGPKPDRTSMAVNTLNPITPRGGADFSPVSPRKPLIIPESETDFSSSPPKNQSVQLAPIKGPVPPKGIVMNKRLEFIKGERTGANRSPTPPGWHTHTQPTLSNSQTDNSCAPLPQRRKKKKKKKSTFQISETHTGSADSDDLGEDNTSMQQTTRSDSRIKNSVPSKKSSLPQATPRGEKLPTVKRQSELDRSINSLLQ